MGIKLLQPRLTELGKIKIGGKGAERTGGGGKTWRMPVKYDYFVITGHERDSAGNLKEDKALMASLLLKFGVDCTEAIAGPDGKPTGQTKTVRRLKEIPVALLSDEIEDSLSAQFVFYQGKRRLGTCDGETFTQFAQRGDGDQMVELAEPLERPCDGKHHLAQGWKLHTTFQCVISEGEARWGGVYRFRTTSEISADQLLGTMVQVQTLTRGILAGLPLRLVVRPMEVSPEGKATTVYVVHLELRGADLNTIQQQALQLAQSNIRNARELRSASSQLRALLAAPEPVEEQEDVAEEFHPGPENAAVAPAPAKKGKAKKDKPEPEDAEEVKPEPAKTGDLVEDLPGPKAAAAPVAPAAAPAAEPAPKPQPSAPAPAAATTAADDADVDFPF